MNEYIRIKTLEDNYTNKALEEYRRNNLVMSKYYWELRNAMHEYLLNLKVGTVCGSLVCC